MSRKKWVIMKTSTIHPSIHMIGFESKKEAMIQCNLLNERSTRNSYYLEQAEVYTPWEP